MDKWTWNNAIIQVLKILQKHNKKVTKEEQKRIVEELIKEIRAEVIRG